MLRRREGATWYVEIDSALRVGRLSVLRRLLSSLLSVTVELSLDSEYQDKERCVGETTESERYAS